MTEGRRRRALLVATGTYGDPGLAQLRAPTGDVGALAAVLGDEGIGRFDVRQLVDRPTEEVKKEVEGFFAAGRPDDLLLLYFSGHGVLSQSRRFYFATTDTELQWLRATAIEDSFVNAVVQESRARTIVLVLDCCHSGAFGKGLAHKGDQTVDIEHRFEGRGRVTLSASTELEYAFEEADPATGMNELGAAAPGSLFTSSLVEGLRSGEADIDEDGSVSVDELYDYAYRRVRERSPHQTPVMAGDVRGEIVIARSPRRPGLPRDLVQAIASNLAGVRVGAASELENLLGGPPALAAVAREALERLTHDDSRRVVNAARTALGRPPLPPEDDRPVPPPPPPDDPGPEPPTVVLPAAPPAPPRDAPPVGSPAPRRPSRRVVALGGAAALVAVVVVVLLVGPGPDPLTPVAPYDFDRDGSQDVVIGASTGIEGEGDKQSGVVLAHGGPGTREAAPLLSVDAGIPGPPDDGDRFGAALASGDFDRDGYPDLAVGAPGRDMVTVLYGPGDEFVKRRKLIRADRLEEPPETTRSFGIALVAADFDDDGFADLAVGAPGSPPERAGSLPGSVHVFFGAGSGLELRGVKVPPPPGPVGFGRVLAAGDLDADGNVDLVSGSLDEPRRGVRGHLAFCSGTPDGPVGECRGAASTNDIATSSLAVADVNDDDYADVVQGDQGFRDGSDDFPNEAGVVRLWLGGDGGPGDEPQTITQEPEEIPGDPEPGDEFGHDVEAGDVDGDGLADIIVAARGDEGGDGSVTVIRGASSGYSRSASYTLEPESAATGYFGGALSLLDLDADDRLDLLVTREDAQSLDDAVVVYLREASRFAPGVALKGLAGVAELGESPVRVGR